MIMVVFRVWLAVVNLCDHTQIQTCNVHHTAR